MQQEVFFQFSEINKYINQWLQLPWRLAQACTTVSAGRRLLAKLEFNRKLCATLFRSKKAVSPFLTYSMKKSLFCFFVAIVK